MAAELDKLALYMYVEGHSEGAAFLRDKKTEGVELGIIPSQLNSLRLSHVNTEEMREQYPPVTNYEWVSLSRIPEIQLLVTKGQFRSSLPEYELTDLLHLQGRKEELGVIWLTMNHAITLLGQHYEEEGFPILNTVRKDSQDRLQSGINFMQMRGCLEENVGVALYYAFGKYDGASNQEYQKGARLLFERTNQYLRSISRTDIPMPF